MNGGLSGGGRLAGGAAPRVVLICLHADPATPPGVGEGGGTHSYLRELLRFLGRAETAHIVLTRWADPQLPQVQRTSSCGWLRRLRIGPPGPLDKRLLAGLHATTVAAVSEALDEFGSPELLHSVYWNSGQAAMDVAAERGLAFVHTVISNGWRREASGQFDQPPQRVAIERRVFQAAHRIFSICTQERNDLIHAYGVTADKIVVVGRPVAGVFQSPARDPLGRPRCDLPDVCSL